MQPSNKLSIRDQVLLMLGVALLFSFGISVAGYMGGAQTREHMAAFAADAAVADGIVTGKRVDMVMASKVSVWWMQVEFKTDKGVDRQDSIEVANSIYYNYEINSPIKVTYVRSKPEWFYVPGTEPTTRDIAISDGMFKFGAFAFFVSLVGLVGLLFAGGGAPKGRPRTAQSARAGSPVVSSQPRATFGTRRGT